MIVRKNSIRSAKKDYLKGCAYFCLQEIIELESDLGTPMVYTGSHWYFVDDEACVKLLADYIFWAWKGGQGYDGS